MAEGRPEARPGAGESRQRLARVALAALLVVAVVAGLRGEVRPLNFRNLPRSHDAVVGLALEAVLAVLMAALVIRRRRVPDAVLLAVRLRGLIGAALTIGLIGIPVLLLLTNLPKAHAQHHPNPFQRPGHGRQPPPLKAGSPLHLPIAWILTTLLVLAIVAAIVICVIVLRRWTGYAPEAVLEPEDDDEEKLRDAVESGRAALRELGDARAAIIACYLAMERSLASAGAARAAAETPDELLARAAGAGLVHGEAAGRLTALFYEARFSSHPLPASSKAAAQRALSELAASLGRLAAAGPTAAGPAGTGETAP
jgi:Domain of unknown function (DUF4129)